MDEESVTVTVKLLDREFLVGCKPDERAGLLAAVTHLDRRMHSIRHTSRSPGYDRVAILAALDMTHELLTLQRSRDAWSRETSEHIATLRRKLEEAMVAATESP
jgi:cell division protein ZapA